MPGALLHTVKIQILHEAQAKKTTAATAADGALDAAVIVSSGPTRTVRPTTNAGHPRLVEGGKDSIVKLDSRTKCK